MAANGNAQLIAWLEDQGHSAEEIATIMDQVGEYDAKTLHESVFDSIESGNVDMTALIRDAARASIAPNVPK